MKTKIVFLFILALITIVGCNKNETITVNGVSFNMVTVKGGTFWMGAQSKDKNCKNYLPKTVDVDESPVHQVVLSDYYIGETEVTQALWYAVMGQRPTADSVKWNDIFGEGDDYPAYYVSWDDAQKFITKLNSLTGKTFRLPTEAEWEYAARGGYKSKSYVYSGGNTLDDISWHNGNSMTKSHPVGTKLPNELGIYDMTGNIWEWCSDNYGEYKAERQENPKGAKEGSDRILRGNGFYPTDWYGRVSNRYATNGERRRFNGIRLALNK